MSDEGYRAVSGPCDVHHGGPGTPSLAVSGRHGSRQGTVPECPRVPDWPLRRRGGELRPAELRCTEADWGNQAHPAPARSCCLHPAAPAQQTQQPPAKQRRGTGRRATAPPAQAPAKPGGKRRSKRPWDGRPRDGDDCSSGDGERTTPSPRGGLGGESFVSFFSATGLTVNGTQNLDKRAVSSISGSPQGTGGCERVNLESHSPSSLASEQLWAVREGDQSHYSRTLCRNTGKCITHADPASDRQRDTRGGSLRSPSLPHHGYVGGFVGATSTVLGGLASAFQPVSLAPPYHQTRLCDSVRPATSQVSRRPLYLSEGSGCPHLASRDRSPTGKWRDRAGPSSQYEVRVLQPLPKKSVGLRPILDLCVLNRALHRLPFKMLTPKRIFGCVRPQDWFAVIDLKDAYFHVSILPRHRPFLLFVFEGRAYQYKVLPFGLSLSPRVFTKVAEGRAHSQLPRRLAYTSSVSGSVMRTQGLGALAPQPVGPSGQLGKEQTLPDAEDLISRYGVGFGQSDSAPHAGTRSVGVELLEYIQYLNTFKNRTAAPLKQFQRLLGHMAAAAVVTPLGCSIWDRFNTGSMAESQGGAWQSGTLRVQVTPACQQTFTPWSDLSFLRAGVPLEQVSRHAVVYTDASAKGWGATFNGLAVSGVWTGPQLHWHINCLELLAVHLALNRLKRRLRGEHVLVRTDSTATVAYINRQGGLCSRRMSQLAHHLLLWSRKHLRSLCTTHIPGLLSRTADELSRAALPGEWRLHPQTVQLIWWPRPCGREVGGEAWLGRQVP